MVFLNNQTTSPQKLRRIFLEEFTKELIKNSVEKDEIKRLKKVLDIKREWQRKNIKKRVHLKVVKPPVNKSHTNKEVNKVKKVSGFKILENTQTQQLTYPVVKKEKKTINWGPLTPLIEDYSVKSIEGEPDAEIIAKSQWGQIKQVPIKLSNEQINDLLGGISHLINIPAKGDVFRANIKGKIISAVNTEEGIKFTITKIPQF